MNEDVIAGMKQQMEPSAEVVEHLYERLDSAKSKRSFTIWKPLTVGLTLCLAGVFVWLYEDEIAPILDAQIVTESAVKESAEEGILIIEVGEFTYELRPLFEEPGIILHVRHGLTDADLGGWEVKGYLGGEEWLFVKDGNQYAGRRIGGEFTC